MSRENVEAAHQVLDAVARFDLARLLELSDPQIRWQSFFAVLSEVEEYSGHDGLHQYMRDVRDAFEWIRPEPADMLDAGDVVVGLGRIHYRGKGSGVEAETAAGWVFRFRAGKAVRFRAFRDPEESLENVGLGDR